MIGTLLNYEDPKFFDDAIETTVASNSSETHGYFTFFPAVMLLIAGLSFKRRFSARDLVITFVMDLVSSWAITDSENTVNRSNDSFFGTSNFASLTADTFTEECFSFLDKSSRKSFLASSLSPLAIWPNVTQAGASAILFNRF